MDVSQQVVFINCGKDVDVSQQVVFIDCGKDVDVSQQFVFIDCGKDVDVSQQQLNFYSIIHFFTNCHKVDEYNILLSIYAIENFVQTSALNIYVRDILMFYKWTLRNFWVATNTFMAFMQL